MRQTIDEPKRSKTPYILGCCGGGCLIVVIAAIGAIWWATSFLKSLPEPVPTVTMEPADTEMLDATQTRYVEYRERVNTGEAAPTDEFVLTEDEINNAIGKFLEKDENTPRARVILNGSVATGQVSIPWPQDDGTSKWINGEAEFTVKLEEGKVDIRLKRLKVRGNDIPESLMEGFRKENLANDLNNDPEFRKEIETIESIEIRDSKIHVKLKPSEDAVDVPEPEPIPAPPTE